MKNRYSRPDAADLVRRLAAVSEHLALRVYSSRLIGGSPDLVLHGGGNTSVKLTVRDLFGEDRETLFVKGSGVDLRSIDETGFVGVDIEHIRRLRRLDALTPEDMEWALLRHRTCGASILPSVETLAHAFLPHRYIDHTHADAILVLTHLHGPEEVLRSALGSDVGILPYTSPGLALAKQVAQYHEANPEVDAIVCRQHGIFTFADDAEACYSRMIECVTRAESYINERTGVTAKPSRGRPPSREHLPTAGRTVAQTLRGACARAAVSEGGNLRRMIVESRTSPEIVGLSRSPLAQEMCRSGVLTPDHVTRTKNRALFIGELPDGEEDLRALIETELTRFGVEYDRYFEKESSAIASVAPKLDSVPRVVLCAGIGLFALGFTRRAARKAADIAEHTLRAKSLADQLGGYTSLNDEHVFELEYWPLQLRKLAGEVALPLSGQTAFITGAGGAIGAGIADRLLHAGAVVVISDIDPVRLETAHEVLSEAHDPGQIETIVCDVTTLDAVESAYQEITDRLGGVDIVVPTAGIAHVAALEDMDPDKFRLVLSINLVGTFHTIRAAVPCFRRQATGGNIVLISSKNVPAPGAMFGAYSASKAGAHQLGKVAALELAKYDVRVNMVNPDAVFGDGRVTSGLWDLIGPDRMKSRGLSPDDLHEWYRDRNLLKVSVLAEHVGNAVVFFASDLTPTTGASLPVDGGVPAAFPR